MKIDICHSVWDAISDSPEGAANLKLRSRLMDILVAYIREKWITQKEAALRFGVPLSRVSEVVKDRISKFSINKLVNMAVRVGFTSLKIDNGVSADLSDDKTKTQCGHDLKLHRTIT